MAPITPTARPMRWGESPSSSARSRLNKSEEPGTDPASRTAISDEQDSQCDRESPENERNKPGLGPENPGACTLLGRILPHGHVTSGVGGNEACPDGVVRQAGNVVDVEPLHQLGAIRLGRLGADAQFPGDFLGRVPLRDQLQHLARRRVSAAPVKFALCRDARGRRRRRVARSPS